MSKYIQISKVCKLLDCSADFVRQLIRDKKIEAIQLNERSTRVSVDSLMQFVESRKVNPEDFYA